MPRILKASLGNFPGGGSIPNIPAPVNTDGTTHPPADPAGGDINQESKAKGTMAPPVPEPTTATYGGRNAETHNMPSPFPLPQNNDTSKVDEFYQEERTFETLMTESQNQGSLAPAIPQPSPSMVSGESGSNRNVPPTAGVPEELVPEFESDNNMSPDEALTLDTPEESILDMPGANDPITDEDIDLVLQEKSADADVVVTEEKKSDVTGTQITVGVGIVLLLIAILWYLRKE